MSAAYIQVHFRLDLFMEANEPWSGSSLIWVHIDCNIGYIRTKTGERAADKSWLAAKGLRVLEGLFLISYIFAYK